MNQNDKDIDENLLLQYLLGKANETDRRSVEEWLEKEEGNRKQLDQLEALWLRTGQLDPPPLPVDVDAAWDRFSERIERQAVSEMKKEAKKAPVRYLSYVIGAAAVILVAVGIYGLIRLMTVKEKEVKILADATILMDTLPDQTRLMLNLQSELSYPDRFEDNQRLVKLSGEAYFEVARDPSRPFVVNAGRASVQVLGTKFNVSAYEGQAIRVTVDEGRVSFFTVDSLGIDTLSLVLEAGMEGLLEPGKWQPERVEKPMPDQMFWADKRLEFHGNMLSEVFELVEKYYGVKVKVSDPGIYNCRLFASFRNDSADDIMTVIAESFGLQLSVEGNNYYLSGDACKK